MQGTQQVISDWIGAWLTKHPISGVHLDCVTTIMLKILDGKCKMTASDKIVIRHLYAHTHLLAGELFGQDMHDLIASYLDLFSKGTVTDEWVQHIYEKRLLVETMISRPVMKAFKKKIRDQGLYNVLQELEDESLLEAEEDN